MSKLSCWLCTAALLMLLSIGCAGAEVMQIPGSNLSLDLPEIAESYPLAENSGCTADWAFLQQDGTVLELQAYVFPGSGFSLQELQMLEEEQNEKDGYYLSIEAVEAAGIPAICLRSAEELWQCVAYVVADRENFVHLNFWYQGDHSLEITMLMDTLTQANAAQEQAASDLSADAQTRGGTVSGTVSIGDSGLQITLPAGTWSDPLTEEDLAADLFACWYIGELEVQAYWYQSSESLQETMRVISGDSGYDSCVELTLADLDALCYRKHTEAQGTNYSCIGYLLQEGEACVELAFWYPGDQAPEAAAAMIASIRQK